MKLSVAHQWDGDRENSSTRKTSFLMTTFFITNLSRTVPEPNPGIRGEKPAIYCLSHFTACQILLPYQFYTTVVFLPYGPGNVVDIATGYGLDGPGIESRLRRDFPHLSRPPRGHTQPPVQWVPCLSRRLKADGA